MISLEKILLYLPYDLLIFTHLGKEAIVIKFLLKFDDNMFRITIYKKFTS